MEGCSLDLPPFDWLKYAKLYNHKYEKIPSWWLRQGVDVIVLYFSLNNRDKKHIMYDFYEWYENARFMNFPIEVINVPLDSNIEDMCMSYDEQANWFTIMYSDPLIFTLLYMYDVTCVPHLVVIRPDGTLVSSHGIMDIERYGKNALMTWLSPTANSIPPKRFSRVKRMFGQKWRYITIRVGNIKKRYYIRKFSKGLERRKPSSIGLSLRLSKSSAPDTLGVILPTAPNVYEKPV
ncbi:unnamed protein product [Spodoptera littoralis]|uniref:protein-disulfide reductase n=1 Tax=Spodoptera littoralis TaxID=7109 RepID=A0A9P0I3V3_SPOLI|nr:unnamed protein product [Spodoptera littoralis]CAH1640608.1 unnamed protein product [Spodoptera littoralis]